MTLGAHTVFSVSPQKAYIFTFLLSSRLFIEPRELLARVCHLCIEQQQLDQPVLDKVRGRAGALSVRRHSPDCPHASTTWSGSDCPVLLRRSPQGFLTCPGSETEGTKL